MAVLQETTAGHDGDEAVDTPPHHAKEVDDSGVICLAASLVQALGRISSCLVPCFFVTH